MTIGLNLLPQNSKENNDSYLETLFLQKKRKNKDISKVLTGLGLWPI